MLPTGMVSKKIDRAELRGALCAFISEKRAGEDAALDPDAPLSESGVDSFTLLEVLLFLERSYGTKLPLELLTRENTFSVATFTDCVLSYSQQAEAAGH